MSKYGNSIIYGGTTCGGFRGCKGRTYTTTEADCLECAEEAQKGMLQAMNLTMDKKDKREPLKFMPLPTNQGTHMSTVSFERGCYMKDFIDDNGVAYYATRDQLTNIVVKPSDFTYVVEHPYTHVMWFDK